MRWVAQEEDGLARTDRRVGFAGKGRGSNVSGGIMAEYLPDGGWTFMDGLERAQQIERVRQRIMELSGVRAAVFDYVTVQTELGADVSTEELSTELNKSRSNASRELNNLKAKGLAFVARWESNGSRPRPFWKLSEAAAEAMSPGGHSFDSFDPLGNTINRINKINSQDSTAVLETDPKRIITAGSPVEVNRDGKWSAGYVVRDASDLSSITLEKLGNPMITLSNQRLDIDVRPCESPFSFAEPQVDW